MTSLYLDNAATTKIRPEVIEEMMLSLKNFGNTEAKYYSYAENAKNDVKLSRNRISTAINCFPEEVVFTSGATEANNLFIKGLALANPDKKKIIISSIEHSSIRETCHYMKKYGYNIVEIPVNSSGLVDMNELNNEIDENTLFVSIIWVNNEIGSIQDIKTIDEICSNNNVIFHSDATQAIGKVHIDMTQFKALRLLTFTSHKIYGPKGIGALIVRRFNGLKLNLEPLFHGGEQEEGYRAGTLSNELIVGFGKAIELVTMNIDQNNNKLSFLEKQLIDKLQRRFKNKIVLNNNFTNKIPGLINIQFVGQNNMLLLKKMSPYIAASTGSACGVSKPSHVLKAIGLTDKEINNSIRLSLSSFQNIEDLKVLDSL